LTDCWLSPGEVEVSLVEDLTSGPRTVVDREALEKVVFLYLLEGQAHVRLSDVGELDLGGNEVLVVFPGRVLTVELTAVSNRLMSVALIGRGAVRAALGLGFWDLLRTTESYEGCYMTEIVRRFHAAPTHGRDAQLLSQVEHLLLTVWLRIRHGGVRGLFVDAVRTLNRRICSGDCLTTETAAEALGISRSKLNSLFMDGLKIRPGEYISRVIVALAEAQLFWTSASVAQIASRFGFSSVSAFATFFRRRIGQSPTDFRRQPIPLSVR